MASHLVFLRTYSLIFLIFQIKLTISQLTYTNCSLTNDKYTPDSTFQQNLKIVLSNLTYASSTTRSSFYNVSFGKQEDAVYGIYLCRGDLDPENCFSCIGNATQSITKECPNRKETIKWVPECMLRYANRNIFAKEEESPSYIWTIAAPTRPSLNVTVTSPTIIIFNITRAVYNLINETAFGDYTFSNATSYFKIKEYNITAQRVPQMIYFLAQCTPDISPLMCQECLTHAYIAMRGSTQSLAYFPSCHLRYDHRKFYGHKDDNITSIPPSRSSQNGQGNKQKPSRSTQTTINITIPAVLIILLLFGLCFLIRRHDASNSDTENKEFLKYDFNAIKAAVNNFSEDNLLGRGGFGEVYKGTLQNGEEIAVKRLTSKRRKTKPNPKQKQVSLNRLRKQKIEDFKTEVLIVAKLQHKNLVRLLGYCDTQNEKLIIFEYLPFSSLDKILFDPQKHSSLVWKARFKIIDGIAKGLLYLHEESRHKIIHRDLKPANILLDREMTPKISDFGLAKMFGEDEAQHSSDVQHIRSRIAGTLGYIAPEYIRDSENLSVKSDVYSFGILVLEIVSGQRIRSGSNFIPEGEEGLLLRARRLWQSREPLALVDPALSGDFSAEEASRCIHIGLLCSQDVPDKRPTMASIVGILSNDTNTLPQLTPESFFKSKNMSGEEKEQDHNNYSGMKDIMKVNRKEYM